jgi:hypothetical protein
MSPHQRALSWSSGRPFVDAKRNAKKSTKEHKKRIHHTPVKTALHHLRRRGAPIPTKRHDGDGDGDDDEDDGAGSRNSRSNIMYYSRVTTYRLRSAPQHSPLLARRLHYFQRHHHIINEVYKDQME